MAVLDMSFRWGTSHTEWVIADGSLIRVHTRDLSATSMLVTDIGDNFYMLVTVLAISVPNIHYLFTSASDQIQPMSPRSNSVTNIQTLSPILSHQHHCHRLISLKSFCCYMKYQWSKNTILDIIWFAGLDCPVRPSSTWPSFTIWGSGSNSLD